MYIKILLLLIASLSTIGQAEEIKAIDSVEARKSYYRLLEYNMVALAPMAMGKVQYDPATVKIHVNNLLAMEHYNTASLFPVNTSKSDMPGRTRALPIIWADFQGVAAKGKAFKDALMNLKENSDKKTLGASIKKLGSACMGCHKLYVAEKF